MEDLLAMIEIWQNFKFDGKLLEEEEEETSVNSSGNDKVRRRSRSLSLSFDHEIRLAWKMHYRHADGVIVYSTWFHWIFLTTLYR